MSAQESPEPLADLDTRALRCWIASVDPDDPSCDEVALYVSDGDITVRAVTGMGGSAELARLGAERLADAARQFAGALAPKSVHGPLNGP